MYASLRQHRVHIGDQNQITSRFKHSSFQKNIIECVVHSVGLSGLLSSVWSCFSYDNDQRTEFSLVSSFRSLLLSVTV